MVGQEFFSILQSAKSIIFCRQQIGIFQVFGRLSFKTRKNGYMVTVLHQKVVLNPQSKVELFISLFLLE